MADLRVVVEFDLPGGRGVGGGNPHVPAIDDHEGRLAFEVCNSRFDGDRPSFTGYKRDVIVGVKDGQHTLVRPLPSKLQVGHEGDLRTGIVQSHRQRLVSPESWRAICASRVTVCSSFMARRSSAFSALARQG